MCLAKVIVLMSGILIHIFSSLFTVQAVTDDGTTTTPEPSTTSEPEPPCSNETPEDNGNQVQPEDNNLTTLNNVDNLTNESGQQHQQCNTFEPNQGAEVGKY